MTNIEFKKYVLDRYGNFDKFHICDEHIIVEGTASKGSSYFYNNYAENRSPWISHKEPYDEFTDLLLLTPSGVVTKRFSNIKKLESVFGKNFLKVEPKLQLSKIKKYFEEQGLI